MDDRAGIWNTLRQGAAHLEDLLLSLLLVAMILLACLQILLRTFFAGGFLWGDPLLRNMVLWAGMFGAAVATRQGKHITIDIASHLLPDRWLPWLAMVNNFFATTVTAILTYAAVVFVRNEMTYGQGSALPGIPSWGPGLVFPLAFGLITLRFLFQAVAATRKAITGTTDS